jgi:hypothetical protein
MPIGKRQVYSAFLKRYVNIIKAAVEEFAINGERVFRCVRADEIERSGSITRDVLRHLRRADVVIADLTRLNPNVFYELGVRHSLRSGTILIAEEGTRLPFDVNDLRIIWYKLGREEAAKAAITKTLSAMIKDGGLQDSPVLEALPQVKNLGPLDGSLIDGERWKRLQSGLIVTPLDGTWLEILDRQEAGEEVRHYSIFRFQYDEGSHIHPFRMVGDSFRPDGSLHSHWETCYMRIELEGETVAAEYIFSAVTEGGESKRGYGLSRFYQRGGDKLVAGRGSYLAGEEEVPYRCQYRLERVEHEIENVPSFIKGLAVTYGPVSRTDD